MPTTAAPQTHRWTRREYHDLVDAGFLGEDDPVELINGENIHTSPQNTPHVVAVRLVRRILQRVFSGDTYMVDEQLPLALGPESEPEPDVSVVEGQPRDVLDEHPLSAALVVEVAEASLQSDRTRKRDLYARHALPEYWIVNLVDRQLEVHRAPTGDAYPETAVRPDDETVSLWGQSVAVSDLLPQFRTPPHRSPERPDYAASPSAISAVASS
jgi:Uma2 family endonuclease